MSNELQGRRLLDVKSQCCENGGDALLTIVSVKDPSLEYTLSIDRENLPGSHIEVAKKLLTKIQSVDPDLFIGVSICPRDTNVNDTKVVYCASY